MPRYFIESLHTPEECLRALDEVLAKGAEILAKFDFGCAAGDHTGYAIIEAQSHEDVMGIIPGSLRNKARIVEVDKFTPDQIRSFHEKS